MTTTITIPIPKLVKSTQSTLKSIPQESGSTQAPSQLPQLPPANEIIVKETIEENAEQNLPLTQEDPEQLPSDQVQPQAIPIEKEQTDEE